VRVPRR
jgi:hypothetical protein